MARLRAASGHTVDLPPGRVSVGESAANEIPIAGGNGMAAVHFRLQPWASGYFLEDAGSGLGTLVNGAPVSWVPLRHGDVITAGEMRMVYETADGGAKTPAVSGTSPVPEQKPDNTPNEAPGGPVVEQPPAWLPEEALQPAIPPWLRPPPSEAAAAGSRRTKRVLFLFFLLMGALVWLIYGK